MTDRRRRHIFDTADLLLHVRDFLRRHQDDAEAHALGERCQTMAEAAYLHALPDGGVVFSETANAVASASFDTCVRVAVTGKLEHDDALVVAMAAAHRTHSIALAQIGGDDSGGPFPHDAIPAAVQDVTDRVGYVREALQQTVTALAGRP